MDTMVRPRIASGIHSGGRYYRSSWLSVFILLSVRALHVSTQPNLSNTDIEWTEQSVRIREASVFL